MSSAMRQPMTVEEFLAWERQQETKHEFDGVAVRAMVGAKQAHLVIQMNLFGVLTDLLRGKPCRPWSSDAKIRTNRGIRYPDAFVSCSEIVPDSDIVADPVAIFEIISPASERIDRFVKDFEYRMIASLQTYVILEQAYIGATVVQRSAAGWQMTTARPGAMLDVPGAGIQLLLNDLYAGLDYDMTEIAP